MIKFKVLGVVSIAVLVFSGCASKTCPYTKGKKCANFQETYNNTMLETFGGGIAEPAKKSTKNNFKKKGSKGGLKR